MSKHEKFELEDLPKSAVVNSSNYEEATEADELINEAVSDHLNKIAEEESENDEDDSGETITPSVDAEDAGGINDAVSDPIENVVDIEQIKQDAYNAAMEEAKAKYEPMLEESDAKNNFSELLESKLSSIVPKAAIDSQIAKVSAEAISGIAKKLYLILPANFEEIIVDGLTKKIQNFYKEGEITLTVHPDRHDFCIEILQSDKISSKLKDSFQVVKDDNLGKDDCKIEWNDTKLEYSPEQLTEEIDKIIERLKSAA